MSLTLIKEQIPDFARDTRLNIETVSTPEGAPGLTQAQIWSVMLASSYAVHFPDLTRSILGEAADVLSESSVEAAKSAAAIMAMNNVYYRAQHLMEDAELKKMPARLRMNVIGKAGGVEKVDFELMCFAVSAIAGCGQCLTAHLHELRKAGLSDEGVQSSLRIASVVQAVARALEIARL